MVSTLAALGSAGITGAASLGSSLLSGLFASGDSARAQRTAKWVAQYNGTLNAALQGAAEEFNREEAYRQRAWEEYMSSSAYQRARLDLDLAGFNPMLAVNNGGASSPSGAAASAGATSVNAPAMPGTKSPWSGLAGIGQAVNSALDVYSKLKQLDMAQEKTDSEVKNLDADTLSTTLDSLSKDPDVVKERRRYGENGLMGQAYHFVRSLADGLGFTDSFVSRDSSSNSALRGSKVSDEFNNEVVPKVVLPALSPRMKHEMSIRDYKTPHSKHH